ncbi:unnamed protein product [Lampetra fluviatilis]
MTTRGGRRRGCGQPRLLRALEEAAPPPRTLLLNVEKTDAAEAREQRGSGKQGLSWIRQSIAGGRWNSRRRTPPMKWARYFMCCTQHGV